MKRKSSSFLATREDRFQCAIMNKIAKIEAMLGYVMAATMVEADSTGQYLEERAAKLEEFIEKCRVQSMRGMETLIFGEAISEHKAHRKPQAKKRPKKTHGATTTADVIGNQPQNIT